MSRLAKQPIEIPEKVTVTKDGKTITVKGPKGELTRDFRDEVTIEVGEKEITLTLPKSTMFTQSLWGTYSSHLRNMMHGVTEGYEKKLIIEGVGFKANLSGKTIEMSLGFSHTVKIDVPEGLDVKVEKNEIVVAGIDKEAVGSFAASVRAKKKPEPYKGKGIRYHDEVIRRKEGKKTV
jgi:large subunit ribosomal protein L6